MTETKPILKLTGNREELYREAVATYGSGLVRLAGAYEADRDRRRDLLQEIHLALWRSFEVYEARCSMRTWVYRIAHNTAASYVISQRRANSPTLISLQELDALSGQGDHGHKLEQRMVLERLLELIHRLKPLDRQIMLLYLEDMDASSIGEVVGISPGHVRTQIHRIKTILATRFRGGERHGQ